ncbi:MAG TPA: hypothetical protein VFA97_04685 [Gaiellaceae bacterium]|nr:hypothetical protein [Gaiellaceae bacterium]
MNGQEIVGSDDHKIGTVVAERDGCAIVEMGHVFKSKHAVPQEFLHEQDGVVRATIAKDLVADSPKLGDEWDVDAVKAHYGLVDAVAPEEPVQLPAEALGTGSHSTDRPAYDRLSNSSDPAWTAAGISETDPQRDDALDRDEYLGDPPSR